MALHSAQTAADGIHVLPRWEYVDTAARDAASYLAADVGGVARVGTAAPYTFWVLTNSTGPAWAQIGSGGSPTDEKVAVSSGDTTPGYLEQKLVAGAGITLTKLTPGGDEDLEVSLAGGSGFDIRDMVVFDHFVTGNLDADEIGSYGWRKDMGNTREMNAYVSCNL